MSLQLIGAHRPASNQTCRGGVSSVRLVGHDMWFHRRRSLCRSHPLREFLQVNTLSRWVKACQDFHVGCGVFMPSKQSYYVLWSASEMWVPWCEIHINVFLSRGKESVCHKSWEKPTPSLWMKSQSRYRVYFYFLKGPFICQVDIKCDVRKEIGVCGMDGNCFDIKLKSLSKYS